MVIEGLKKDRLSECRCKKSDSEQEEEEEDSTPIW